MTGNPTPLSLGEPLHIDEARHACQVIARNRHSARESLERAMKDLAEKERLYRHARAVAYVTNKGAPSAGMRDALVDDETADDRYERDLAKGMVEAAQEMLKEIDAQRASLHRLIDWSSSLRLEPEQRFQDVTPRRAA